MKQTGRAAFALAVFSSGAVALSVLNIPIASAAEFELRLGHDQPVSSNYQGALERFAKEVAEKTGDRVEIDIFPGAQLGSESAMLEGLEVGNIDMSVSAAANASTYVPAFNIFSAGYLFDDADHFKKVLADPQFEAAIDEKIEAASPGFRRVATITAGLRNVYNNRGPIETLADLQGLKMRVMASPIEAQVWGGLGALPLAMPMGDVYTGMQTGLLAAGENAASNYVGLKHYEVAPYYSLTGHQWLICFVLVSDITWNRLPEDVQQEILAAGDALSGFSVDYTVQNDAEALESVSNGGPVKLNEVETAPFKAQLQPLQDEVAETFDAGEILKRIRELE
jgi:tripartite ATP-independent transporter DctP family solute receptor